MLVYRAMCEKEAVETLKYAKLSFNSRFKWFGTLDFVLNRVLDGNFNNSVFDKDRYTRVLEFDFAIQSFKFFEKCGNREFMLDRRKYPLVKLNSIREVFI